VTSTEANFDPKLASVVLFAYLAASLAIGYTGTFEPLGQ
jgi:hypothetical protein